jgi:hypothetical protein
VVSRPNFSDLNPILAAGNATINLISKGKRASSRHIYSVLIPMSKGPKIICFSLLCYVYITSDLRNKLSTILLSGCSVSSRSDTLLYPTIFLIL